MRWADKELICYYAGYWQVCKSVASEYPTPEAVIEDHIRHGRKAVFVEPEAVFATLTLLNGRRPTREELAEGYDDDEPF